MEGNYRGKTPAAADVGCGNDLNRSNSDSSSSLSAENCEHILRRSANVKLDDSTAWTNEKHSLYLEHLEVSFVKQLHQSMNLFAQCSEQSKRDQHVSQRQPGNVDSISEQYGCWQKINCKRGDPPSPVSSDSHNSCKSPYRFEGTEPYCSLSAADMPELFTHCSTENDEKEGTGQNFVDEDIPNQSNTQHRAKRLKTALSDSSSNDQIVPSEDSPTTDY